MAEIITTKAQAQKMADTINAYWEAQGRVANARVIVAVYKDGNQPFSYGVRSDCVNGVAPFPKFVPITLAA